MGKNQLIHGNEFHLLKQAEIHKATGISRVTKLGSRFYGRF